MAKLGNWRRRFRKTETHGGKTGRTEYAIREDGSVVQQVTVDGHARGWTVFYTKLATDATRRRLVTHLLARGYEEVTR